MTYRIVIGVLVGLVALMLGLCYVLMDYVEKIDERKDEPQTDCPWK